MVAVILVAGVGCGRSKPPIDRVPAFIKVRPLGPTGADASVGFEGATGHVRVTVEVGRESTPPRLNDVLFRAEGSGKLAISLDEHGKVRLTCRSVGEESSAELDRLPWEAVFETTPSIQTTEPTLTEEGKEIVLARFDSEHAGRKVSLTWKAVFSREPVSPRVKVGMKPTR